MALSDCSWLSDEHLVTVALEIRKHSQILESQFDIFYHSPTGDIISSCDYFSAQIEKIKSSGAEIFRRIMDIVDIIKTKVLHDF